MSQNKWNDIKPFVRRTASHEKEAEVKKEADMTTGGVSVGGSYGGSGSTLFTRPLDYRPEFASPDRYLMPTDLKQLNKYWRMFYQLDPVAGSVVDIYSEMPLSDYQIVGTGVEGEVKEALENMCEETHFINLINNIMVENLVIGESIPHLYYNNDSGLWKSWSMHRPEDIDVVDTHLSGSEPFLILTPDANDVKNLVKMKTVSQQIGLDMPGSKFIDDLSQTRKLVLEPLNVTYIPRYLHPYDLRGTSLFTRLWRTFMFEDAVFNACHAKGTKVVMADRTFKNIEDVVIGDKVLNQYAKEAIVTDAWQEKNNDAQIEIILAGGHKIISTQNHKYPVFVMPRTCACGCGAEVNANRLYIERHGQRVKKDGQWSKHFDYCQHCKRTDRYYGQCGLCYVCATQWRRGKIKYTPKKNGRDTIPSRHVKRKQRLPLDYQPIQKITVNDMRIGDYLLIPRSFKVNSKHSEKEVLMARLLGYYVAEGSTIKTSAGEVGVSWALNINEKDTWAVDIQQICKKLHVEAKIYTHDERNSCIVMYASKKHKWLTDWLVEHGNKMSLHKKLSATVMSWSYLLKKEFLKGLFRGDGSYSSNKTGYVACSHSTVSEQLSYQVRSLLLELGYFVSCTKYDNTHSKSKGVNPLYKVSINNHMACEFVDYVWGHKGEQVKNSQNNGWWVDDDYVYVRIKNLRILDKHEKSNVYNLTVDGDHSYLVDSGIATYNSIQTAKRHASPLKVVSMGDLASGYIPSQGQIDALMASLAQSELDPQAWLFAPPGTKFEAWGTTERLMGIRQEYDTIERIKLMALGVSKDFISGDTTFASAQAGLQVFLSRLLSFRTFIEETFIYPKYFLPIVKVNKWQLPTKAEVDHKVKTPDRRAFVKPKIQWEKTLKARIDKELLEAYKMLVTDFEIKVSERTLTDAVGLDWEDEVRKNIEETRIRKMIDIEGAKQGEGMGGGFSGDMGAPEVPSGVEEMAPAPEITEEGGEVSMHASNKGFKAKFINKKEDVLLSGAYNALQRGSHAERLTSDEITKRLDSQTIHSYTEE